MWQAWDLAADLCLAQLTSLAVYDILRLLYPSPPFDVTACSNQSCI